MGEEAPVAKPLSKRKQQVMNQAAKEESEMRATR